MNTKIKYLFLFVLFASILAACSAPAPAPTAVPASTVAPALADPAEVAQGFWKAMNSQNIDAAMAFVADDVKCRGGCYFTGKDSFSAFMLTTMEMGKIEISDLKVISEDTITYTWELFNAAGSLSASGSDLKVQIKDGKIALIQFP